MKGRGEEAEKGRELEDLYAPFKPPARGDGDIGGRRGLDFDVTCCRDVVAAYLRVDLAPPGRCCIEKVEVAVEDELRLVGHLP